MSEGVIVALVGGMAAILAPTLAALVRLREIRHRVGKPNGDGNVVQMLERLLHGQTLQDQRLAAIEKRQNSLASRLGRIEQRQQDWSGASQARTSR